MNEINKKEEVILQNYKDDYERIQEDKIEIKINDNILEKNKEINEKILTEENLQSQENIKEKIDYNENVKENVIKKKENYLMK